MQKVQFAFIEIALKKTKLSELMNSVAVFFRSQPPVQTIDSEGHCFSPPFSALTQHCAKWTANLPTNPTDRHLCLKQNRIEDSRRPDPVEEWMLIMHALFLLLGPLIS